jgi:hypothetical protein
MRGSSNSKWPEKEDYPESGIINKEVLSGCRTHKLSPPLSEYFPGKESFRSETIDTARQGTGSGVHQFTFSAIPDVKSTNC